MTIVIQGEVQLARKFKALGAAVGVKALKNAVGYAMTPVRAEYKRRIPKGKRSHKTYKGRIVAPGFASRSTVKSVVVSKDKHSAIARVGVKREAFYVVQYLERGTSKVRANPALRLSFRAKRDEAKSRFSQRLKKNIDKAAQHVS